MNWAQTVFVLTNRHPRFLQPLSSIDPNLRAATTTSYIMNFHASPKPNATSNFEPSSCKGFTLYEALVLSVHQGVAEDWGLSATRCSLNSSSPIAGDHSSTSDANRIMNILQDALEGDHEDLFGDFVTNGFQRR